MQDMPEDQLVDQVIRSITGQLSESGRQELSNWAQSSPERERFLRDILDPVFATREMAVCAQFDPKAGFSRWLKSRRRKKIRVYVPIAAAASLFLACAVWWAVK